MNKTLLDALVSARKSRRERHIAPEYIPFNEIPRTGMDLETLRKELNEAYKEGYIKVHRGINQNLIELVKDGNNE